MVTGLALASLIAISACSPSQNPTPTASSGTAPSTARSEAPKDAKTLTISAIPDQDPEQLNRLYTKVAAYFAKELQVPVKYVPVTDYTASVTAFKVGDLDLVWYGGLTGVQARLQVPGAEAIAQRDVDEKFRSVFIANQASGLKPIANLQGLAELKGRSFTFGSESSTSGRLMPQYFLAQAGVKPQDFKGGQAGFSKNHDATIELVTAGTYEAGVLNKKVWDKNLKANKIDSSKVAVIFETPPYFDYHWVINPSVKERFGADFPEKVKQALLKLSPTDPEQKEILDLFTAEKFIPTQNENYKQIEQVGREIGKIK